MTWSSAILTEDVDTAADWVTACLANRGSRLGSLIDLDVGAFGFCGGLRWVDDMDLPSSTSSDSVLPSEEEERRRKPWWTSTPSSKWGLVVPSPARKKRPGSLFTFYRALYIHFQYINSLLFLEQNNFIHQWTCQPVLQDVSISELITKNMLSNLFSVIKGMIEFSVNDWIPYLVLQTAGERQVFYCVPTGGQYTYPWPLCRSVQPRHTCSWSWGRRRDGCSYCSSPLRPAGSGSPPAHGLLNDEFSIGNPKSGPERHAPWFESFLANSIKRKHLRMMHRSCLKGMDHEVWTRNDFRCGKFYWLSLTGQLLR